MSWSGKVTVYQAKRYQQLTPAQIRAAVEEYAGRRGRRARRYFHGTFGALAAGPVAVFPRCGDAPAMIGTRRGEPRGAGTRARRTW